VAFAHESIVSLDSCADFKTLLTLLRLVVVISIVVLGGLQGIVIQVDSETEITSLSKVSFEISSRSAWTILRRGRQEKGKHRLFPSLDMDDAL
jgi:hypothetical protein